ncbi:C-terminal binding protein [Larkinella harenae]
MTSSTKKIVITDHGFSSITPERTVLEQAGYEIIDAQCKTEEELVQATKDAFALLVQWAPITKTVIQNLENCQVIVRYGIGVDNIDLAQAREKQIPVCNVPDYCIDEVADHTLALALTLNRQVMATDKQIRDGIWKIIPPGHVPACKEAQFSTLGFGRIARAVLKRARAFNFKLAAFDPFVSEAEMQAEGVRKISLEEAITDSDLLSLHLPLDKNTYHLMNRTNLVQMRPQAVLINTSRGGLINTVDLADALINKQIGGAGIDVFEQEPLPADHPLREAPNAILTSHTAWYSTSSIPILQKLAAEEVLRTIQGKPLKNRVV